MPSNKAGLTDEQWLEWVQTQFASTKGYLPEEEAPPVDQELIRGFLDHGLAQDLYEEVRWCIASFVSWRNTFLALAKETLSPRRRQAP
jgi:hypothetical protein